MERSAVASDASSDNDEIVVELRRAAVVKGGQRLPGGPPGRGRPCPAGELRLQRAEPQGLPPEAAKPEGRRPRGAEAGGGAGIGSRNGGGVQGEGEREGDRGLHLESKGLRLG